MKKNKVIKIQRMGMWLSFVDSDLPLGERFLGVVILDHAPCDILEAAGICHRRGINPGGEVRSVTVDLNKFGPEDINRLLSREESTKLARKA